MRSWAELKHDSLQYLSRKTNRTLAPPDWLTVNLTLRCNLSCVMCTTCYDAPELSLNVLLDLIDQAALYGIRVFNPLGGEPFVRPDLETILAHAAHRHLHTTLTTNGTLIHPHRAAKIAAIPPEKLHINISIDGLEATHNQIRGAGTFQKTLTGYKNLRTADQRVENPLRKITANCILHKQNVAEFPALIQTLKELGFSGVQVLNLFREGTPTTDDILWFDAPSLGALEKTLAELMPDAGGFILNPARDLKLIPRYYREGLQPLEAPCWAGWKELYINTDGTAIMCNGKLDFLDGKFGSIYQNTLQELWHSAPLTQRREVVKHCTTPCMQSCYLRRESDSGHALVQEAVQKILPRKTPVRALGVPLILELCDIPAQPGPKLTRLLRGRAPDLILENPSRYWRLLEEGGLDTTRGFLGAGVVEQILSQLAREGVQFSMVGLSWRGDPGFHPELERILETVARYRFPKVVLAPSRMFRVPPAGVGLGPGPSGRAAVVSWDAKLTADTGDILLANKLGDVLHTPFSELWGQR